MEEYKGIGPIQDSNVLAYMNELVQQDNFLSNALSNENAIDTFITKYKKWIHDTKNNNVVGLDAFKHITPTLGTTQSFDAFYLKHSDRRFCVFAGEYIYHKIALKQKNFHVLNNVDDLTENDAFIISIPFSDLGDKHSSMDDALKKCSELNIPVLVDCAYFGTCSGIEIDLEYPCIETVVFSLSKTFPVAHLRIGMRCNKTYDDDGIDILKQVDYTNRFGAVVGSELMNAYSSDYIYEKYYKKQQDICNKLNVAPAKCVLIGIGDEGWKSLNRGNTWNRLCLSNSLIKK